MISDYVEVEETGEEANPKTLTLTLATQMRDDPRMEIEELDDDAIAEAEAAAVAAAEEKNKEPSLMAKIFKSAAFQVSAAIVWF